MTLPSSGPISMSDINTEFSLGRNMQSYWGVTYYKSDNVKRTFSNSGTGNFPPISFSDFLGAMKTRPVSPTGDVGYGNGSTFSVPYYNVLIVKMQGGQAGGQGNQGYTNDGCGGDPTGKNGSPGGTTYFGGYASASGGAPNSGAGAYVVAYIYADSTPGAPTRGTGVGITIGQGGPGGQGGDQTGKAGLSWCSNFGKAGSGATGSAGYLTVSVQ